MNYERSFEYDAFGPWIYLIEEPHSLPPLFAGYKEILSQAVMCFKVPRNMERQKADPNMNLYDSVIGIFEEEIIILERKTQGQNEFSHKTVIDISQITAIHIKTCLLNGQLFLITKDEQIIIRYNTISDDIMNRAITLIRRQIPQEETDMEFDPLKYSRDTMAVKFVNAVNKIVQNDNSLKLVAYQKDLSFLIPREFRWKPFAHFAPKERILSSFVVLYNSKEVVIISCHYYPKRASAEAYAYHYYFLPIATLDEIFIEKLAAEGLSITFRTNQLELHMPIDSENTALHNFADKLKIDIGTKMD